MPLKPEYKPLVLSALRSGHFKQRDGIGDTRFPKEGFCAISVGAIACGVPYVSMGSFGTTSCAEYLGLTEKEMEEWYRWNDNERLSFSEIADLIEEKY